MTNAMWLICLKTFELRAQDEATLNAQRHGGAAAIVRH